MPKLVLIKLAQFLIFFFRRLHMISCLKTVCGQSKLAFLISTTSNEKIIQMTSDHNSNVINQCLIFAKISLVPEERQNRALNPNSIQNTPRKQAIRSIIWLANYAGLFRSHTEISRKSTLKSKVVYELLCLYQQPSVFNHQKS